MKSNLLKLTKALLVGGFMLAGASSAGATNGTSDFLSSTDTKVSFRKGNSGDFSTPTSVTSGTATCATTYYDSNKKFWIKIDGSYEINNTGKLYLVIEADKLASTKYCVLSSLSFKDDETSYGATAQIDGKCVTATATAISGHQIYVLSPTSNITTIAEKFADASSAKVTSMTMELQATNTTDACNIYRVGLYTLAEMMSIYSTDITYAQFVNGTDKIRLDVNAGTTDRVNFKTNSGSGLTLTAKLAKLLFKSIGDLPNTKNVDIRNLTVSDLSTNPVREDFFTNLGSAAYLMLNYNQSTLYPTTNTNVCIASSHYYAVKDGSLSNHYIKESTGSSGKYASFTRNFSAGYSTCVLPFDVTYDALTTAGLTAYTYSGYSDSKITFAKVTTGSISANTPFVVNAPTAGLYVIGATLTDYLDGKSAVANFTEQYVPAERNTPCFVGSYKEETPRTTDFSGHYLVGITSDSKLAYMKDDTKVTYYRAFIDLGTSGNAKAFTLSFGDEATGISEIESSDVLNEFRGNGVAYNMAGQRVDPKTKGIVIINGKKILNK